MHDQYTQPNTKKDRFFGAQDVSLPWILYLGSALRIVLIAFGRWQDTHFDVKYTDIDYVVYTDAARFLANGLH